MATVVAKLFAMVAPDAAFFGQKDAQQCVVVRRLIADLNLPIELEICPTVREADGLAMSSRNVRLDAEQRQRAVALIEGLRTAEAAVASGVARATTCGTSSRRRCSTAACHRSTSPSSTR